jgi:hypothetical protein
MIIEQNKCTSDSDSALQFHAHKQEAKELFLQLGILTPAQFEEVIWNDIHDTLHSLPKMFQLFAGKQDFGVSAVLGNLSNQKDFAHLGNKCPSCSICTETTQHILLCQEVGWIRCLNAMIKRITEWMIAVGTAPDLVD